MLVINHFGQTRQRAVQHPSTSPAAAKVIPNPRAKLLDQMCEALRVKHYSIRSEDAYVGWIHRFIFFHAKPHEEEVAWLSVQHCVWLPTVEDQQPANERSGQ